MSGLHQRDLEAAEGPSRALPHVGSKSEELPRVSIVVPFFG